MNSFNNDIKHFWLSLKLAEHRDRVKGLLQSLTQFKFSALMPFSLFQRTQTIFDEIAHEKKKEQKVISEIVTIEDQHKFNRNKSLLKEAQPLAQQPKLQPELAQESENEAKRPIPLLWWLLALWYLFKKNESQPKQ